MSKAIEPNDFAAIFDMSPNEAINYLDGKGYRISFDYRALDARAHNTAFTVAGVMSLDVLKEIKQSLTQALSNGIDFKSWRDDLKNTLARKGYWGEKIVKDPKTGERKKTDLTKPYRMALIFRNNIQSSLSAGRYVQQIASGKEYLMSVATIDDRSRPKHAANDGVIYHRDSAFWRSNYPPNGHGCRCGVIALSSSEIIRKGLKVSEYDSATSIEPSEPGFNSNPADGWKPDLSRYSPQFVEQYKRFIENNPHDKAE